MPCHPNWIWKLLPKCICVVHIFLMLLDSWKQKKNVYKFHSIWKRAPNLNYFISFHFEIFNINENTNMLRLCEYGDIWMSEKHIVQYLIATDLLLVNFSNTWTNIWQTEWYWKFHYFDRPHVKHFEGQFIYFLFFSCTVCARPMTLSVCQKKTVCRILNVRTRPGYIWEASK